MLKGFVLIAFLALVTADCSDRPTLQNGILKCHTHPRTEKTVCNTKCSDGYRTIHARRKSKSECIADGEWSKPILDCHNCGRLKIRANLTKECSFVEGQVQCQFRCNEGYEMYGPQIVTCVNGSWDLTPPLCKKKLYNCENEFDVCEEPLTKEEKKLLHVYETELPQELQDEIDFLLGKYTEYANNRNSGRKLQCFSHFCDFWPKCKGLRVYSRKFRKSCHLCVRNKTFMKSCPKKKSAAFFGR